MGTTTLATLRQNIGKLTGTYVSGSTTTNITANNHVIDSKLANIFYNDDELNNLYWLWLSTTNNASVERTISDHAYSTGTITIRGSALVAETASQSFELHKFKPSDIMDAINRASIKEYDTIYKEVEDTTLSTVANQTTYSLPSTVRDVDSIYLERELLYNFDENILEDYGGFETWTGGLPDGTDTPTGMTLTQVNVDDDMPVKYGNYACMSVVTASTNASHYFTEVATPANYDSQKTSFQKWVYCTTAERVRVGITDNASTSYSDYHNGGGWELLTVSHTTVASPTSLKAGIFCTSGVTITIYYDNAVWTRDFRATEGDWELLRNWRVSNSIIYFPYRLPERRALRIVGRYPLSALTTDASTVEINDPQVDILMYSALTILYQQYKAQRAGQITADYDKDISYYMAMLSQARDRYSMNKKSLELPIVQYWR
jgi:hypothetical protein